MALACLQTHLFDNRQAFRRRNYFNKEWVGKSKSAATEAAMSVILRKFIRDEIPAASGAFHRARGEKSLTAIRNRSPFREAGLQNFDGCG